MQSNVAVMTMVRDDSFFLEKWVAYYGGLFGRENLYVINHGHGESVKKIAEGCNVIGIPGDHHKNFDMKRWRLLNGLLAGLRTYHDHVIVGDVDELVVLDPDLGTDLLTYLKGTKPNRVLTPLGLEVMHRIDIEEEVIDQKIIGPRRHVRLAPHYSKPCIISKPTRLARGGHFSESDTLIAPPELLLFHLKFCDFAEYSAAMDRRNEVTQSVNVESFKDASIGRHWFSEMRGEDQSTFMKMAKYPLQDGFDLSAYRQAMHDSWKKRDGSPFWQFDRPDYKLQFELPERFVGTI